MKTLLKLAAFIVLGLVALAAIGFVLHIATVLLTIAVPVAVVGLIGWVVWKAIAGGGSKPQSDAPKQVEASKAAEPAAKRGLSNEEAAKHFDELKKGLKS